MTLDVKHLEIVRAVHEAGALSRACQRLHMTQPALTRQLTAIEQRLGVTLFRRHARGMTLTPAGERILATASRVLAEIARAEVDVRRLAEGHEGTVRVSSECYMCYHWLPSVARIMSDRHPGVTIELVPESTRDPFGALQHAAVDVALVYSAPADESEVQRVPLFQDEMVGMVATTHTLAQRAHLEPTDFESEALLCHYAEPNRGIVETAFLAASHVVPRRTLELMVTPAVLAMARAGYGIAIAPRWLLDQPGSLDGLVALSLGEHGLWRPWYAAHDIRRSDDRLLHTLLDALRTALPEQLGGSDGLRPPLVRLA